MTDIITVPIHHDELDAESWVPPESVASWLGAGWEEGPLPRLQAERDAEYDRQVAAGKAAAEAWDAANPSPKTLEERRLAAEAALAAQVEQAATEIDDDSDSFADEPAPSGDFNPIDPEEG